MVVNRAFIHFRSANVAFVELDCKTKNIELDTCFGSDVAAPSFYLYATIHTPYWFGDARDALTRISLPEFAGWEVYQAQSGGRYTIRITLYKGINL